MIEVKEFLFLYIVDAFCQKYLYIILCAGSTVEHNLITTNSKSIMYLLI